MAKHVIETVMFGVEEGVSREEFVAAAAAMTPFLEAQPGFLRRRLSCTEDGTWIEHIEWEDMSSAKHAASLIGEAPEAADFVKSIVGPSVKMMHSELEFSLK